MTDPTSGQGQRTGCHFFELNQQHNPAPNSLCGRSPKLSEMASFSWTSADYAPSKADCRGCCLAIGE